MDPNACLTACDQAISDGDIAAAMAHLEDYRQWRCRGGFEPIEIAGTTMRGDVFAAYCERRIHDHR
jgi:hypothetical protein